MLTASSKVRTRLIWLTLALFMLTLSTVLINAQSPTKRGNPKISWTPKSLDATVSAGASNTFNLSFVASENISNVTLRVVPELQDFVEVSPAIISNINSGESVLISAKVSALATTLPQTRNGTIQLRSNDGNNIANPLPANLNIIWATFTDTETGVSISYPSFGLISKVDVISTRSGGTQLDIKFQSGTNTNFVSTFSIFLFQNTNHLSLSEWFHQQIDPKGDLITSGAFTPTHLPNGFEAMVLSGAIPGAYLDEFGPVMAIYSVSSSGNTIISIDQSQTNELDIFGLSEDQINQLLQTILAQLQVP